MIIKFAAYFITASNAILTDALESIINVIASGFAFYSLHVAALPKDKNHPYGHGKVEFFSAGFEGALIILAGFFILYEATIRLLNPVAIQKLDIGILFIVVTIIGNGILGYKLKKTGQELHSLTLEADGKHLLTDSISSSILVVGMIIVLFTDIYWIDSALSYVLAVVVLYKGYQLTRQSIAGLMDEADEETLKKVLQILKEYRKATWIDIHNLRIQKYGSDLHIDCHVTLPYYWSLKEVHDEIKNFEDILKEQLARQVEIFVHADPCLPECCKYCRMPDCNVRQEEKRQEIEWTIDNLSKNQKHFIETDD